MAGDALAWGQLQLLCRHWKQASGAAQPMVMVHPGAVRSDIPAAWLEHDSGYPPAPCVYLECPQAPEGRRAAALAVRLAELIAEVQPCALVVAGNSFDLVHLVLMARQLKLPIIRLAAGEPDGSDLDEPVLACDLMNRSADLLCVPSVTDHQRLLAQGIASWRVARVAPLTSALLRASAPSWPSVADTWAELNLPSEILRRNPRGYALLTGQVSRGDLAPLDLMQWLMVVRHAQNELPLIWLTDPATADALAEPVLRKQLRNSGVVVATVKGARPKWSLLRQARCVIAGPGQELVEEAQLLGVPSVAVHLHGDRRANWMGFGVAQVGPSKAQLLAAVRAAVRMPREVRDPASLGESAVWDVTAQIQHWLNHRDALPFQLHAQTAAA